MLTGNTSLEALLPLLTRYLATIPAAPGRGGRMDPRQLKPLPFSFPEQPVVEDVEVMGVVCGVCGFAEKEGRCLTNNLNVHANTQMLAQSSSHGPWRGMQRKIALSGQMFC